MSTVLGKRKSDDESLMMDDESLMMDDGPLTKRKSSPDDQQFLKYASDATRARYNAANPKGKDAILRNVANKYRPALEEWEAIKLTSEFQKFNIDTNASMSGGKSRKYRGGVPPAPPAPAPAKTNVSTPVANTLETVISDAQRLWLSGAAALGTPGNVAATLTSVAIGIANPAAAAGMFTLANRLVGVAYGLVTPTTFTLTVLITLLYRNFGHLLNKKPTEYTNLQELLSELKKNIPAAKVKYGAVAMPSPEIMAALAALDKLEKAAAAEKAAADAKAASDAATAAVAKDAADTAEKEAKDAVKLSIATSQNEVDATIQAGTPSTTGGRKTKKRGLKKARKTRRGIRKPRFKY
jgi:hypothetical protein